MVVFAITREGYLELEPIIKTLNYPVWVGAGVLSTDEHAELRSLGLNLTDFSYAIEPTDIEFRVRLKLFPCTIQSKGFG